MRWRVHSRPEYGTLFLFIRLRCLDATRKAVLIGGDSARSAATGKRPSDDPKKHNEQAEVSDVHPANHGPAPRFGFGGKMPVPVIVRFMQGPG